MPPRVEAGPPAVADEVVAHVLFAEVGEGDGVLDEDGVVLGHGHQGAPAPQRQRVDLDRAPRVHLAREAAPRLRPLRPAKYRRSYSTQAAENAQTKLKIPRPE